jgi:hypothetical protein
MKISDLKPGQVLFDVRSTRMGNTTMRTISVWRATIKDVDPDGKKFTASWNGNPHKLYWSVPKSWKKKDPFLVTCANGFGKRRPTREELAEHRRKLKEGA